jgi:branched-chain amino acid transport system permease protein
MYWVDILNQCLIFAIMAMSLNLQLGYAGQVSVAHAAFAAIGGYAGGYL